MYTIAIYVLALALIGLIIGYLATNKKNSNLGEKQKKDKRMKGMIYGAVGGGVIGAIIGYCMHVHKSGVGYSSGTLSW